MSKGASIFRLIPKNEKLRMWNYQGLLSTQRMSSFEASSLQKAMGQKEKIYHEIR